MSIPPPNKSLTTNFACATAEAWARACVHVAVDLLLERDGSGGGDDDVDDDESEEDPQTRLWRQLQAGVWEPDMEGLVEVIEAGYAHPRNI